MTMGPARRTMLRYVAILLLAGAATAGLCLMVNALVDPLWYFRGNVITGVNYAFNERLSRLNRLLPDLGSYDCLMLGSSTTALLPEQQISGHRCFNLSFSAGVVSELLLYARYLRARGHAPVLVIVGVDEFDFEGPTVPPDVPRFILDGGSPPSLWHSYLSLDALDFSLRTLRGDYPNHRVLDRDFRAHVLPRRRPYRPPLLAPKENPGEFHPERAALYVELRRVFPEARAVGFVPPISAWTIAQLALDGRLDAYLAALGQVGQAFDVFLDFGIPSEMTASTTNTFDGIHYADAVNEHVAAALVSGDPAPGIDWHRTPPEKIAAAYAAAIERLISPAAARGR